MMKDQERALQLEKEIKVRQNELLQLRRSPKPFSRFLKRMRHEKNISAHKASLQAGKPNNFFAQAERHGNEPRLSTLQALAKGLGIPTYVLVAKYEAFLEE